MKSPKEDDISDEDIPSDFFDDFNKEEFMEGLSVIDSWDVKEKPQSRSSRSRIDAAAIDGVSDLRELIGDSREDRDPNVDDMDDQIKITEHCERSISSDHGHSSQLDNYIKPGSRRDLRKTNEAIKKDKAVKVKEYLSKHLDSVDDLKPPGTELDDFLNDSSAPSKRKGRSRSPEKHSRHSSPRDAKYLKSPKREHLFKDKRIYYNNRHENPREKLYFKPYHKFRQESPSWRKSYNYNSRPRNYSRPSPLPFGPRARSPRRRSPRARSPRGRSPHRYSPRRQSPRWRSRSRSPTSSKYKYSDKQASMELKDSFLYPVDKSTIPMPISNNEGDLMHGEFYGSNLTEYSSGTPGYSYMQNSYPSAGYEYGPTTDTMNLGLPQPTSAQIIHATPSMVPPPFESSPVTQQVPPLSVQTSSEKPYDALAKVIIIT